MNAITFQVIVGISSLPLNPSHKFYKTFPLGPKEEKYCRNEIFIRDTLRSAQRMITVGIAHPGGCILYSPGVRGLARVFEGHTHSCIVFVHPVQIQSIPICVYLCPRVLYARSALSTVPSSSQVGSALYTSRITIFVSTPTLTFQLEQPKLSQSIS